MRLITFSQARPQVMLSYQTKNSFNSQIIKNLNTTKKDKYNTTGVYKITCHSYPKLYIDQTGRSGLKKISCTIKEHKLIQICSPYNEPGPHVWRKA